MPISSDRVDWVKRDVERLEHRLDKMEEKSETRFDSVDAKLNLLLLEKAEIKGGWKVASFGWSTLMGIVGGTFVIIKFLLVIWGYTHG